MQKQAKVQGGLLPFQWAPTHESKAFCPFSGNTCSQVQCEYAVFSYAALPMPEENPKAVPACLPCSCGMATRCKPVFLPHEKFQYFCTFILFLLGSGRTEVS